MSQIWEFEKFYKSDPNNFNSVGEQYIMNLKNNIRDISGLYNTQQFDKSFHYLTEIICQSKTVYAIQLDDASTNFKNYLDQYMEEHEGIKKQKINFTFAQQREAVNKFINLIEIAKQTINSWYQFKQLPSIKEQDLFQLEINQIRETYDIQENQHCSFCQLI